MVAIVQSPENTAIGSATLLGSHFILCSLIGEFAKIDHTPIIYVVKLYVPL